MAKKKFTDANGKVFEVHDFEITDFQTDLGVPDANIDMSKVEPNFKITQALDSEGKVMDITKLTDEEKKDPNKLPKALDVTFEATHSGPNRNNVIYHSDSMEKDAASWMSPFAKPLIMNHDIYSEPIGRATGYEFKQSDLNPERDCIAVTYRVTDQDAIAKFMDGRYKTMSIGGSMKHITCNICGKDILKDGVVKFCGHWKGETYGGNKCLWNGKDIEYKEGSVVNSPADDWAQATNVVPVNDSTKDGEGGKPNTTDSTDGNGILDTIDTLTGVNSDEGDGNNVEGNNGEKQGSSASTSDGQGTAPNGGNGEQSDSHQEPESTTGVQEIDQLKTKITDLEANVNTLTQKVTDIETENNNLKEENKTLKDEKVQLQGELKVADDESKAMRKQCVQLAVMNKDLMAKRIIDMKTVSGELKAEDKDTTLTELLGKTAKELNDMSKDLSVNVIQRTLASVQNPGLNNNKDPYATTDDNGGESTESDKHEATLADMTDAFVDAITRGGYKEQEEEF